MKNKIVILIILAININSCKAQKTSIQNHKIMIPKIDNAFEKFDIEIFNMESIRKKRIIKNNKIFIEEDSQNYGYSKQMYPSNSFFKIISTFYKSGIIKEKGLLFNNGSQYGIWYKFDEQGNLTEEINTDEGYDFGWEQILKYCEKNKIKLTKGYKRGGYQTSIYKQTKEGKKVWKIEYLAVKKDTGWMTQLYLDGKTGSVLEKKERLI